MSTRANIVIKDGDREMWFYRHSDGYPEGTLPTLNKFLAWVRSGKIRDNISQSAGWLILIGAKEYNTYVKWEKDDRLVGKKKTLEEILEPKTDWKVGAYEPTVGRHGDIEYLYTIDLNAKTVTYIEV